MHMLKIALSIGLALGAVAAQAAAQYPERPITLVLGFPPGGGADHVARVYADNLGKVLKQPVVVENKPGAGSTIGASVVARAKPDGYTLYLGNSSVMGSDAALYKVNYTPDDFIPVARLTTSPMILIANKASGISSVKELLDRAAKQPDSITFASSGNGVITHLAAVEFMKLTGLKMLHIPFKGGAPATQSVAAGDTQISFATAPSARAVIDTGKVVGLGITSEQSSRVVPQYQPIAEQGVKGYNVTNWWGVFVPKGTPQPVIDALFAATNQVLAQPNVVKAMESNFEEVSPSKSQKEFEVFARKEGRQGLELAQESTKTAN